ncbi:MAG: extracellular solute-binding protein [Propionibacteriaceae bacterium]|jgi:multiple sugar transport system substrate-binding protein|nr:extracellular solute-binding protein [Propionibacteriaceae bacterium]
MFKRPLTVLLGAALALGALAACSGGEPNTDPSGSNASEVTITYWHGYSVDSSEVATLVDQVIPAFEAAHPGVKVEQVAVPYDDLHQKLVTGVAGGVLPDVVRSDIIWVPELADLGVLEPLDVAMSDFSALAARVYPGPLETNAWDGHYYGLPLDTNTLVQFYNPAVYQAAGVNVPTTTAELVASAAALKDHGVYAFGEQDLGGWNVLPWIWSFGGDITNAAVTQASGAIDSPASVAAIQWLYDLYKAGDVPTIITQSGAVQTNDGFAAGEYGMILGGPWMYPIFQGSYPDFAFESALVPAGPGGSVSVVGGEDIVVTASSPHKAAALDFVRYLLSEEAQRAFAEVGQFSVLQSLGPDMTSIQPYYSAFVDQLAQAKPRPPTPAWPAMDAALKAALQEVFLGDGDIPAALSALAVELDALLAQYN